MEFAWPGFTYLVLSLQSGEVRDIAVWLLNEAGTEFSPDELKVV